MLLHQPFEVAARDQGDKTALVVGSERRSYHRLDSDSNRIARGLLDLGVRAGERVAISLPNGPELVTAVLATMKAGAAFVVINPGTKPRKLASILSDCAPRTWLADADLLDSIPKGSYDRILVGGTSSPLADCIAYSDLLADHDTQPVRSRATDRDLCYLLYTSGSTGNSKGVMMSHKNATTAADAITTYLELTIDDVILSFSPMASDYGLYNALMPLRVGATAVVEPRYLLPAQILQTVANEGVTGLALVPTIVAMFLQAGGLENQNLASIRFLTSTGQAFPTAHITRLRNLMPQCRIYSMYGLTECKRVSYLDPNEIDRRPTSVGKAMPGTETWLIDATGRPIDKPHEIGELVIRGDHVMQGYWNRPDETGECLHPAPEPLRHPGEMVLHSGDYFEMDEEGFLYFISRKDELIKSSGERISPREIEDCIFELDGVTGAVVTAIPDEILGHAIHATVAISETSALDADAIRHHCAENLERLLVPKVVQVGTSIPQTLTGKIRRR